MTLLDMLLWFVTVGAVVLALVIDVAVLIDWLTIRFSYPAKSRS
jgi:hypothetical protein